MEGLNIVKTNKSKTNIGFMIGFAGSLVEKKLFFLRFQSQFKYVSPIKFTSADGFLANEKIDLSHLFIGLQTGFKIYPVKN